MKISEGVQDNQFADIAVTSDSTVYITWRQFESRNGKQEDAVVFVKSTDGGKHFTKPRVVANFDSFDAADTSGDPQAAEAAFKKADGPGVESDGAEPESSGDARDCGSGPFACKSGLTFSRHDSQARSTADPKGDPSIVYVVFDAVKPGSVVPSNSMYNSPTAPDGTLTAGQGAVYFVKTTNGGRTWSRPSLISDSPVGHQFFPDINADGGYLHAIWHDSRNDPAYNLRPTEAEPDAEQQRRPQRVRGVGGMCRQGRQSQQPAGRHCGAGRAQQPGAELALQRYGHERSHHAL